MQFILFYKSINKQKKTIISSTRKKIKSLRLKFSSLISNKSRKFALLLDFVKKAAVNCYKNDLIHVTNNTRVEQLTM